MIRREHSYSGPVRSIMGRTDGPLSAGQVGLILAPAGVGKSSLLCHVALEELLGGGTVLHVSSSERIEDVRGKYDQAFRSATGQTSAGAASQIYLRTERNRMIHSYRERTFEVDHFRGNLEMLADVAQFRPTLIVLDGLTEAVFTAELEALHRLAIDCDVVIWVTQRCEPSSDNLSESVWPHVQVALRLISAGPTIEVTQYFRGGPNKSLGVYLDPASGLAVDALGGDVGPESGSIQANDCTLYSGGARGSETVFGQVASGHGIHEVNFTFEGHRQERTKGRYLLSAAELAAGNVSLVYVSNRLNRTYSEGSLIRRVLQTLWHMVSRSQQIFVVGEIQTDGTVVGGTGWSVELARMWDKELWVYDQVQKGWFQWNQRSWVAGTPIIHSSHHCGTGTRYLTEDGRQAIEDLYRRSFPA